MSDTSLIVVIYQETAKSGGATYGTVIERHGATMGSRLTTLARWASTSASLVADTKVPEKNVALQRFTSISKHVDGVAGRNAELGNGKPSEFPCKVAAGRFEEEGITDAPP